MYPNDGSAIFRPVMANQAVAALLLIENSKNMMSIWPHLRDQHLPTLIGTLRIANPVAPIKILVLTSAPVDDPMASANGPREYYELPDVRFDLRPDNKISTATIRRGVELLASAGFGESTARHIIIVAASTPVEEPFSPNISDPGYGLSHSHSQWHILAQRLTQKDIQCHMILSTNQDMNAFSQLFHETLRLQQFEEVAPWFPTGGSYIFHLSARPIRDHLSYGGPSVPRNVINEQTPSHRNFSFPPDVHTISTVNELSSATIVPSDSPMEFQTPTLVARLQQAHGLTKKKIYGAKPVRQPFFREDRVREKYRQAPTPLTIPISVPETTPGALVHHDGSTSRTKLDRKLLGEKGSPVSPTDLNSRSKRPGSWSRRGSRVSSPETDASLSSPTSISTYGAVSPVLPLLTDFDTFTSTLAPPPVTPSVDDGYLSEARLEPVGVGNARLIDTAPRLTEPSWPQGHYLAGGPPLSPSAHLSNTFNDNATSKDRATAPRAHRLPRRHSTSYQPVLSTSPARPPSRSSRPIASISQQTSHTFLSMTQTTLVDGDAPFIFNDEYDAITPARPEEVLRLSPSFLYPVPPPPSSNKPFNHIPPVALSTRQNPYSSAVQPLSPASSTPTEFAYRRNIYPQPNASMKQHSPESQNPGRSGTNAGSSSLTGWAG